MHAVNMHTHVQTYGVCVEQRVLCMHVLSYVRMC